MNKKSAYIIAACTIVGLVAGYAIFGKMFGHYVSLKSLFSFGGNVFQSTFRSVSGIESIRNKILLCGAGGLVAGTALIFNMKKK